MGQAVEILIPERFPHSHPLERAQYPADSLTLPICTGLELYGRRKDGIEFPLDIMFSSLQPTEEPFVTVVIRDITERKRTEESLRRSEERFRLLVQCVKDYAIFMLDTSGRVASWNEGAQRIKGYEPRKSLASTFLGFTPRTTSTAASPTLN